MSIFKRIFGDRDDTNNNSTQLFKSTTNCNVKSMGQSLQKKFSRGVQYNMKIVIRGDRNVGKSALLSRLKGEEFLEQYLPTDEIQVGSIHWSFRELDDVIKCEVWDVVDKGRKRQQQGLKLNNKMSSVATTQEMCLDSDFLDVYKACHGVILMLDMTKSWTLQYVEKELVRVPAHIPVLVLSNHRDMGHHRTISADQVTDLITTVSHLRPTTDQQNPADSGPRPVHYWECSLLNGYGLLYIYHWLNVPFLHLQRQSLLAQLNTNSDDSRTALQELTDLFTSPDQSYDEFIKLMKSSKNASTPPTPSTTNTTPPSINLTTATSHNQNSNCAHASPTATVAPAAPTKPKLHVPQARPIPGMERLGLYPIPVDASGEVIVSSNTQSSSVHGSSKSESINAHVISKSQSTNAHVPSKSESTNAHVTIKSESTNHDEAVFDFVPDDHTNLSGFLDDRGSIGRHHSNRYTNRLRSSATSTSEPATLSEIESQDEQDLSNDTDLQINSRHNNTSHNPMVAGLQDDIDDDLNDVIVPIEFHHDSSSDQDNNHKTVVKPSIKLDDPHFALKIQSESSSKPKTKKHKKKKSHQENSTTLEQNLPEDMSDSFERFLNE